MPRVKYAFMSLTVSIVLGVTAPAMAATTMRLNWNQNSISWNQLQNVFNQNPGINQFMLHFPNGANWNINATEMEEIYNGYRLKAENAIHTGTLPTLMFSSMATHPISGHGITTIPINNAVTDMQLATRNMLDELTYEKYHLAEYLPDWLKKVISLICIGFGEMYDVVITYLKKWF